MGARWAGLLAAVNLVAMRGMAAASPKVIVVGNGPSGMTMAAVLAGWRPYYVSNHPHPAIHSVVSSHIRNYAAAMSVSPAQVSLLDLDLPAIAMELGLRGRSNNPVALLADQLLMPMKDAGRTSPSCLEMRHTAAVVPHVVIGSAAAGGSWNAMPEATPTLSPAGWMELPGHSIARYLVDVEGLNGADIRATLDGRISRQVIARYYRYCTERLRDSGATFVNGLVTGITRTAPEHCADADAGAGTAEQAERDHAVAPRDAEIKRLKADRRKADDADDEEEVGRLSKRIKALKVAPANTGAGAMQQQRQQRQPGQRYTVTFTRTSGGPDAGGEGTRDVAASAVILATGTYDLPKRLGIPGEDRAFVAHRGPLLYEPVLDKTLVVVGAGMSAADSVTAALAAGWAVVHVFRTGARATKIGDKFGSPSDMYDDYYKLFMRMGGAHGKGKGDVAYTAFPASTLAAVSGAGECTILSVGTGKATVVKADKVHVLIGAAPQLGFCDGLGAEIYNETTARKSDVNGVASTHPAYVGVSPVDLSVAGDADELYAMGPLRGDNFVRFLVGDAWAVWQRLSLGYGGAQP